jgi:hypothetical protein
MLDEALEIDSRWLAKEGGPTREQSGKGLAMPRGDLCVTCQHVELVGDRQFHECTQLLARERLALAS